MKINIDHQSNILSLPTDFATLENITDTGRFHYVIKYNVNVPRAVKEGAFLVKIHATLSPPDVKDVAGFVRLNSREVIQNLLTRQAAKIESNRAFSNSYIATVVSDITSKIPNNQTIELKSSRVQHSSRNHEDTNLTAEKFLFQKHSFKLAKASDLTARNVSQPILQTPLYQPAGSEITPTMSAQEHGADLIFRFGIDPAQVGTKTSLVADTEKVRAGILQRPRGVARDVLVGNVAGSVRASFGILNLLVGDPRGRPSDQFGVANTDYAHVQVYEKTNILTIEEDLFLNVSDVGDQFYLIFDLQDIHGIQTETVSSIVHNSRNLSVFTLPVRLPFVSATQCSGYNLLELKQIDPNGAGVIIYKKIIDTHTAITEANYVQVAKISLRTQDGSKWYKDLTPGMRPVIYRVIAYNRAELKGHDFASVVVNPSQKVHMVRSKTQQRRLFVSLNAKILDKTIQIELNDIPAGVLSMRIYRQDLSRHETLSEATRVGNVYVQKLPSPAMRFYVTDTTPVDQRIYDYRVLLIFRDGSQFWSSSNTTIQFNPIVNNIITTSSTPIKVVNVGSELDITFILSSVIAEGKIDKVKKAMEQQGILGFFQNDITTNRALLQNLIAYQIKRANLTTGEVEDMGVFIGPQFSDKEIGRNKGVKPVTAGNVYEYTINTHFRSAQSLLTTFTTTVTDTINSSRTYSFAPARWQHPVTLRDGNLVSTSTLQRNHANTDFTFGTIGDIIHIRISLAPPLPSVDAAIATTLGKGKVLLQWHLKGTAKQIDHFLVTREEMGMKTVVGKAHSLTDASSLQFIDSPSLAPGTAANPTQNSPVSSLASNLETAAIYYVTPVLFDLSHGSTIKSTQIIHRRLK